MLPAKCAVFAAAAMTCLIAAGSAPAATDPSVCPAGVPLICSRAAAVLALKQFVAAHTGRKVWRFGPVACVSPGGSLTSWLCDFTGGRGNVGFRETRGAWTTTVRVICGRTALETLRPAC